MAPLPELFQQLQQVQTVANGEAEAPQQAQQASAEPRLASWQEAASKADLAPTPEDHKLRLGFGNEMVARLVLANAELAQRVDELEAKLAKNINTLKEDLSVKLSQRVDELENGVSVVIHDHLSFRRHVEAQLQETTYREDAEVKKLAKQIDTMHELVHDAFKPHSCVTQSIDLAALKELSTNRAGDYVRDSLRDTAVLAMTVPARPSSEQEHDGHSFPNERHDLTESRPSLRKAQPSLCDNTEEHGSVQRLARLFDRKASPARSRNKDQQGTFLREIRLCDRTASEPRSLNRQSSPVCSLKDDQVSLQCNAELLDQMIAESEATLGKIKKIAATGGQTIAKPCSPIAQAQDGKVLRCPQRSFVFQKHSVATTPVLPSKLPAHSYHSPSLYNWQCKPSSLRM